MELVNQEQLVTIRDLSDRLGVSYMTIWRDLKELESRDLVHRFRGGAAGKKEVAADHKSRIMLPSTSASDWAAGKKAAIGRYAAKNLIEDGDSITVEAGTTASSLIPFLENTRLTVLTNGLAASVMASKKLQDLTLICSGGILIETGAFTGPQAEEFFSEFRVKKAFFGAKGFTLEDGFTDPSPLYIRLKNAMKKNTEKIILMIDSSKFGTRSLIQVMNLNEVDIIVTDDEAPREIVDALLKKGVDIRIAKNES